MVAMVGGWWFVCVCTRASSPRKRPGCAPNMKLEGGKEGLGKHKMEQSLSVMFGFHGQRKHMVSLYLLPLYVVCAGYTCAHSYLAAKAGVRTIKLLALLVLSLE